MCEIVDHSRPWMQRKITFHCFLEFFLVLLFQNFHIGERTQTSGINNNKNEYQFVIKLTTFTSFSHPVAYLSDTKSLKVIGINR